MRTVVIVLCLSSLEALVPSTRPIQRQGAWLKMGADGPFTSSEVSRRSVFSKLPAAAAAIAAASLSSSASSWAVDLDALEASENSQLGKLSAAEKAAEQAVAEEESLLKAQESALKADYKNYIADLKAQEKLETKETKLIKKLAKEGTKPDAKQLAKLKEIEGELSAARTLTQSQEFKVNADRSSVSKIEKDDNKAKKLIKNLKAEEGEIAQVIEEAEIVKIEEKEILAAGGNLNDVQDSTVISKGVGKK